MSRPIVAVVGLEDGPESCAGPGLLAALGGERVVAIATGQNESGAHRAGLAANAIDAGDPGADERAFVERLVAACQTSHTEVVLAGSPRVGHVLARHEKELARRGAKWLGPSSHALERTRAEGLHAACGRAGLAHLSTRDVAPDAAAKTLASEAAWPVMLCGADGARRRCVDLAEALRAERSLRARSPERVSVCAPKFRELCEVTLVLSKRGAVLGSAAVRFLEDDERVRPWLAVTIDDPELLRAAREVALTLQFAGPVSVLFQLGERAPLAIDAQPAFPVWIEAALREGPNLVEVAVAAASQRSVSPAGHVPAGTLFSQTAHDVVVHR